MFSNLKSASVREVRTEMAAKGYSEKNVYVDEEGQVQWMTFSKGDENVTFSSSVMHFDWNIREWKTYEKDGMLRAFGIPSREVA